MYLEELIGKTDLKALTNVEDKEVNGVFISDMLSDVMSSAQPGCLWITVQTHKNIVSAANLIDIAAIVIPNGKEVPEDTIELANRFHVVIIGSALSTFELAGKFFELGLK